MDDPFFALPIGGRGLFLPGPKKPVDSCRGAVTIPPCRRPSADDSRDGTREPSLHRLGPNVSERERSLTSRLRESLTGVGNAEVGMTHSCSGRLVRIVRPGDRVGEAGESGRETTCEWVVSNRRRQTLESDSAGGRPRGWLSAGKHKTLLKGLILAQNERWRTGLGMQVARTQQWGAA